MTAVVGLTIGGPAEPWAAIGLRVVDGCSWVGGVRLGFAGSAPLGVRGWTLAGSPSRASLIDGLPTSHDDDLEPQAWEHDLGAVGIDHVVAMTTSIERTCGEIERVTGEPLKRVREAGPVRQGFHRLGPVVVEVVEVVESAQAGPTASFWGFVITVDDIHEAAARLGPDLLSLPKPAVQPGRFIASFRDAAGLGLPLAIMSR